MSIASPFKPNGPSELLFNLLITFLCPLFLGGPTGNTDFALALAAAIETVNSLRIRNALDLLIAVQIVGFAVASLGSLGLSMAEGLSVSAVLRCRSNANALQRSSDRGRRLLEAHQAQDPADVPDLTPAEEAAIAASFRKAAEAQQQAAEARAVLLGGGSEDSPVPQAIREIAATTGPGAPPATPLTAPPSPSADGAPAAQPPTPQPPVATPAAEPVGAPAAAKPVAAPSTQQMDREGQIIWASAMAEVAGELAGEMAHLSPQERRRNQMRIDALSSVSHNLISGVPTTQPFRFNASGTGAAAAIRPKAH